VTPPMLQAAMPVEAVTATASGLAMYFLRRDLMISRKRTDLPVPVSQHTATLRSTIERRKD
jgi:hypothetical protein